ncbi:hypothetical protein CL622_01820, partial [archaeon]|nr:hypothetical protein [archaeon]
MYRRGINVLFRDLTLILFILFAAIAIIVIPHINPPTLEGEEIESPGQVIVQVRWTDNLDADVDLWVKAPGDRPVGYSNLNGTVFNLLRDDLGTIRDLGGLNYENAFSRGTPPGEYVVNLHLFRASNNLLPVKVWIKVLLRSLKNSKKNKRPLLIFEGSIELQFVRDEQTAIRFELDEEGALVSDSKNNILYP